MTAPSLELNGLKRRIRIEGYNLVRERLTEYAGMTEREFEKYLSDTPCKQENVIKAARHSLTAGGKRLRPALLMEFCRVCGGNIEAAVPCACAVEMLHTFSLIHDDLPCMDNDDMRRGKPSCHKAFGETNALLAGDALAMLPFEIIAKAGRDGALDSKAALEIIALLGEKAGIFGMTGGQVIDTENEGKRLSEEEILEMYRLKTACLIEFSCRAGCIGAGASKENQHAAGEYAVNMGLAFQIIDDILDVTADEKKLGKPVGSDKENEKYTYVSAAGIDKAREKAEYYTHKAEEALSAFPDNEFLTKLTETLLKREY